MRSKTNLNLPFCSERSGGAACITVPVCLRLSISMHIDRREREGILDTRENGGYKRAICLSNSQSIQRVGREMIIMAVRLISVIPLLLSIHLYSQVYAQSKLFVDPERQACERREAKKRFLKSART